MAVTKEICPQNAMQKKDGGIQVDEKSRIKMIGW